MARRSRAQLEGVDALFGTTTSQDETSQASKGQNSTSSEVPKYERMEPWTARVRPGQTEFLQRLAKEIMANREDRRERITKNTVLRAWLTVLEEIHGQLDLTHIADEDELQRRLHELVTQRESRSP